MSVRSTEIGLPNNTYIYNIFGDELYPSPQIIETANDAVFRDWALTNPGRIEILTNFLIERGHVDDAYGAIGKLDEVASFAKHSSVVRVADLNGDHLSSAWSKLSPRRNTAPGLSTEPSLRRLGSISHAAIGALFAGKLHFATEYSETDPDSSQRALFDLSEYELGRQYPDAILPDGSISSGHIKRIEELQAEAEKVLKTKKSAFDNRSDTAEISYEAASLVAPIYGDFVRKLPGKITDEATLLTLLSWAQAIREYHETGPRPLVLEIEANSPELGIKAGRIDAIDFESINGRKPNQSQLKILRSIASQRIPNVETLVQTIESYFGPNIRLDLIDFKFPAGDGSKNNQFLTPSDYAAIQKHDEQVRRYIALSGLAVRIAKNDGNIDDGIWNQQSPFNRGTLEYFFNPDRTSKEIRMSDDETRDWLARLSSQWRRVLENKERRLLEATLTRYALGLLEGKQPFSSPKTAQQKAKITASVTAIDQLIEASRKYIDEHKLIEEGKTFRNGGKEYLIRYDRFLDLVDSGAIETGYFYPETGGMVSCLNPDHDDSTPSMQFNVQENIAHCYGCKMTLYFVPGSIPKDIKADIKPRSQIKQRNKATIRAEVPAAHFETMKMAQELLSPRFKGGQGEIYVVDKRKIDADLAASMGAGFANNRFTLEMFDRLRSSTNPEEAFHQLVFYGFVGFSPRVSRQSSFIQGLLRRGVKLPDMTTQMKTRGAKEKVDALPYGVLHNHVTVPLEIPSPGFITNFYGREVSTTDRRLFHRKLKNAFTKVEHGAFNIGAIYKPSKTLLVAEGFFDALSLMMFNLRDTEVLAMIGVNNGWITETMAHSGISEIGIALDFDETGVAQSENVNNRLITAGYAGEIFNYTVEHRSQNPELMVYKDYNQILEAFTTRQ